MKFVFFLIKPLLVSEKTTHTFQACVVVYTFFRLASIIGLAREAVAKGASGFLSLGLEPPEAKSSNNPRSGIPFCFIYFQGSMNSSLDPPFSMCVMSAEPNTAASMSPSNSAS